MSETIQKFTAKDIDVNSNEMAPILRGLLTDIKISDSQIDHEEILIDLIVNYYNTRQALLTLTSFKNWNEPQIREYLVDQLKRELASQFSLDLEE